MSQAAIEELKDYAQWVAYDSSKAPITATGYAQVNNSDTWDWADEAWKAKEARGAEGIGFVFTDDDPFVGIDLDNAVTESGVIKEWAQKVVDHWSSYTELSPSGRGLHIIARGSVPSGTRVKMGDGLLEVYSTKRYFTVTGKHMEGTPKVINEVDTHGWHVERFKDKKQKVPSRPAGDFSSEDDAIWVPDALSVISADDYDVWKDVGMALKDKFGDAGFQLWDYWSSGSDKYDGSYRCRRKWESFRGVGLRFGTFVDMVKAAGFTIPSKIQMESSRLNLTARQRAANKAVMDTWGELSSAAIEAPVQDEEPLLHDFVDLWTDRRPFDPPLIDGLIAPEQTLLISGAPKVGKTFFTAQMAICCALGRPFLGMDIPRPMRVLHIQYEMSSEAMRQRFQLITRISDDEIKEMRGRYLLTSRRSVADLDTNYATSLLDTLGDEPVDLVIVDPLVNAFTGDENSASDISAFLKFLKDWVRFISPLASVVIVHHTNKGGGIRGSSALHGGYDTGLIMTKGENGTVILNGDYRHKGSDEDMTLRLSEGEFHVVGNPAMDALSDTHRKTVIFEAVRKGQYKTKSNLMNDKTVQSNAIMTRTDFRDLINSLVESEMIQIEEGGLSVSDWVS